MHGQKHIKKKTNTASLFRDMYNILTGLKNFNGVRMESKFRLIACGWTYRERNENILSK